MPKEFTLFCVVFVSVIIIGLVVRWFLVKKR